MSLFDIFRKKSNPSEEEKQSAMEEKKQEIANRLKLDGISEEKQSAMEEKRQEGIRWKKYGTRSCERPRFPA